MRKIYILALALFAVFASSMVAVASASAAEELPVWLLNGVQVLVATAVLSEGELLLEDTKGGIFGEAVMVLCSGENEGTVGPGMADEITKIFPLGGKDGEEILCTTQTGICPKPEALAVNLPWKTELLLETNLGVTDIVDDILGTGGNAGWVLNCEGLADTCTAAEGKALMENLLEDVDAIFNTETGPTPKATCSRGGAEAGKVEGEILIVDHPSGTLAVSEVTE